MITKSPEKKDKFALNGVFTKNARTAWRLALEEVSQSNKIKVLLPSYIGYTEREGSGVFDPIMNTGAEFDFYKLNSDLSVDIEYLKQIISADIDVLLIIHYFGFCRSDLFTVRELCNSYGITLVEDCAHAFYLSSNNTLIGNVGDFAFYSIHKYLPSGSGGLLRINSKTDKKIKLNSSDQIEPTALVQFGLSDFREIGKVRRANFELYRKLLQGQVEFEIMYTLKDDDIPQSFPVRVKNSMRESLYFYLMNLKMPTTSLYYRMIDQIDSKKFESSFEISSEILNLPVHQDIIASDIVELCDAIKSYFKK